MLCVICLITRWSFSSLSTDVAMTREGAPAYVPALLLTIVLLAYSRGLVRSRAIESVCQQHVLFMTVCGGATPHFTTLAAFVSTGGEALTQLFTQVLIVCDRQGLIGRQLFAIDGVKLPGN